MVNDKFVLDCIQREEERQRDNLELIASENYVSPQTRRVVGSCLTNKYAEGYPGHRYYGGCENVDMIEDIARKRATTLFGADHANVQPHSGSQANFAAYEALLKHGDTILSADMGAGGHLTHSSPVSFVSHLYHVETYGVNPDGYYDMNAIREKALQCRPKLIVAGASAYPRLIDYEAFKQIADEVGAFLMVDMAHIAGLVAGKVLPSPVPYADIVTTTTHKTLRGTRGGMILCKSQYAKSVDKAIFPYSQGGGLQHVVAGKAVCLYEAMQPSFKDYATQVVKNAEVLANALKEYGFSLVTGGTDNHLILIDLRNKDITGKDAEVLLDKAGITVNKNCIPNDPQKPNITSGIRIGTPAVTTRGMQEKEMQIIATKIRNVIEKIESPDSVRTQINNLCSSFGIFEW